MGDGLIVRGVAAGWNPSVDSHNIERKRREGEEGEGPIRVHTTREYMSW